MDALRDLFAGLRNVPAELVEAARRLLAGAPGPSRRETLSDLRKAADYEQRRAQLEKLQQHAPTGQVLVAQSRDGKVALFQDKDGHLTAVDASKLV